jgi:hypothetical protein
LASCGFNPLKSASGVIIDKPDEQYKPLSSEYIQQFTADKITKQEARIALDYTQTGYTQMNAVARGDKTLLPKKEIERIKKDNETLQKLINKNELPQTMLYRNIDFREIQSRLGKDITDKMFNAVRGKGNVNQIIDEIKNGLSQKQYDIWEYSNFVSTTRDKAFKFRDYPIRLNIKVPQGTKGLPVENLSEFKSEKEVVLNVGTKLKIEDIRFNKAATDGLGSFEIDAIVV